MSKIIWRRAHQVRLPSRMSEQAISSVHAEMMAAYENDKLNWDIGQRIAEALKLDLDSPLGRVEVR